MTLNAGTRFGPYEILSLLGAGRMGEVFKARDTRLGRDVAIKVLTAHIAGAPQSRARFQREARAVAALNHPYICTLHDVGRESVTDFPVMEYLEGETLVDRVKRGPLAIAYSGTRGHHAGEIIGQCFPHPGAILQISTAGGGQPRWNHDGNRFSTWHLTRS